MSDIPENVYVIDEDENKVSLRKIDGVRLEDEPRGHYASIYGSYRTDVKDLYLTEESAKEALKKKIDQKIQRLQKAQNKL